ncbi:aldehyde dehydrogenase family protein [Sphingomonas sp. BIUV-7]|uniref:Aldehyde dehydrogenase family protein n=1 Tax=Sphingomonas natans TaxID=3063330 RepID=A0ABT8Y9X7_9SPHN|nr:aldehyde dehydrogenase family protein [Sphingomonas sp. BIUV-7]MDO6414509.1 aldehyde dehydrogenase family protein [Sphingomonas sp. BIUV-7]
MTDFTRDFTMTIQGGQALARASIDIVNPSTGAVFAAAPDAGPDELDAAVASARGAFPDWAATGIDERRAVLKAVAAIIQANQDDLARLLVQEQGKPLADARAEVGGAAYWANATADLEMPGDTVDGPFGQVVTRYAPLGVCGGIVPWNFPVVLAMFKIAPALLTGNVMILKPSPFTPLTTLKIGELLRGVVPDGVLNVVSGGDALGPLMTAHPGIDKISFTGSTATGKRVMAGAAASLKRITLELGGNDAAIVLPDVDIAAITPTLFWSAFRNAGQICIATKRIYIHDAIYDELAASLAEYAARVVVGDGLQPGVQMGPIQNRPQFERVKDLIADARTSGLRFLTGGTEDPAAKGYFLPITLIDNPPEAARVVQEEAFGPVLPLLRYREVAEAVARANASSYGLGGTVWGRDLDAAQAVADRLETGSVTINGATSPSPLAPFAGHKQSGIGAEGGRDGLLAYTNPKTITIARDQPRSPG